MVEPCGSYKNSYQQKRCNLWFKDNIRHKIRDKKYNIRTQRIMNGKPSKTVLC